MPWRCRPRQILETQWHSAVVEALKVHRQRCLPQSSLASHFTAGAGDPGSGDSPFTYLVRRLARRALGRNPFESARQTLCTNTLSIVHTGRPTSINSAKITHHTISVAKSSQTSAICNCYCDDERRDCPSDSNCSPHGSDNHAIWSYFIDLGRADYLNCGRSQLR